jgi:hypothetical protein
VTDLSQVVRALRPRSTRTRSLHGWKQQADEDGNDCDDDEQLNQNETSSAIQGTASTLAGGSCW